MHLFRLDITLPGGRAIYTMFPERGLHSEACLPSKIVPANCFHILSISGILLSAQELVDSECLSGDTSQGKVGTDKLNRNLEDLRTYSDV